MKGNTMTISTSNTSTTSLDEPTTSTSHKADSRRHLVPVVLVITAVVLALLSAGGAVFYEHHQKVKLHAQVVSLTADNAHLRQTVTDTQGQVSSLQAEKSSLQDKIDRCSVFVPIAMHQTKAMQFELKAIQGGTFGTIIWLPKATAEVKKATDLLDNNQSYDGELLKLCKPGLGQGA